MNFCNPYLNLIQIQIQIQILTNNETIGPKWGSIDLAQIKPIIAHFFFLGPSSDGGCPHYSDLITNSFLLLPKEKKKKKPLGFSTQMSETMDRIFWKTETENFGKPSTWKHHVNSLNLGFQNHESPFTEQRGMESTSYRLKNKRVKNNKQ